jgi:hypothetical protein
MLPAAAASKEAAVTTSRGDFHLQCTMALLLSTCHQRRQCTITVGAQQCLHVAAAIAFVQVGGRVSSALHVSAISFFFHISSGVTNTKGEGLKQLELTVQYTGDCSAVLARCLRVTAAKTLACSGATADCFRAVGGSHSAMHVGASSCTMAGNGCSR